MQRYLTARSLPEARQSLLMSAYWKIPLQVIVLLVGVLVFVFYTFNQGPLIFSAAAEARLRSGQAAEAYRALESEFDAAFTARRQAAIELASARASDDAARAVGRAVRDAQPGIGRAGGQGQSDTAPARDRGRSSFTDVNYIIPTFILTRLPIGLIGLLIVGILMAATDTIAAELNSLSTATVIDFYKRWVRPTATDAHYLTVSKIATGLWGLFACGIAVWAAELGSLIEVVNRFGSFFYGSILGVFILAAGFPRATANGAFVGLIAGMASVAWAATFTNVAFLWHNVIGVVAAVVVGLAVSVVDPARKTAGGPEGPPLQLDTSFVEADLQIRLRSAQFVHFPSACGLAAELCRRPLPVELIALALTIPLSRLLSHG